MNKIGRNDPCHCGSGKKYKKCHGSQIDKASSAEISLDDFFEFDQTDLFKTVGALQLMPKNHGKNIRFELLAKEITIRSKTNTSTIAYNELGSFFKSNFKWHYNEDEPTNFFTDNIIYFGGDYTVFPGINTNGARILNLFLEAIFTTPNRLSEDFKSKIHNGTGFILAISMIMATKAGLKYRIYENTPGNIDIPSEHELTALKGIVSFHHKQVEFLSKDFAFDPEIIKEFIIDKNDDNFGVEDPDKNPFLKRPIAKQGDEYIFVLPSAVVNCLTEFIKRIASEMGCFDSLMEAFYNRKWHKIVDCCSNIGWAQMPVKLPDNEPKIPIEEGIFRFDFDKIAYVRLLKHSGFNEDFNPDEDNKVSDLYNTRTKAILEFIRNTNPDVNECFCVDLHGTNGSYPSITLHLEAETERLELGFFGFEVLSLTEEIDELSLWKFNKSLRSLQKHTRVIPSDFLDMYVYYLDRDYSFYNSDEVKPNVILFSDVASEFTREIYAYRDEHSAPTFYKNTYAGVPVRRFRDFAPIYIQIEDNPAHRLYIQSNYFMFWVKNFQATEKRDKTIIHIINEALIFWLYRLEEALKEYVKHPELRLLEFETILEYQFFTGDYSDVLNEVPEFKVQVEEKVIKIHVPGSLNNSLLQNDNEGEKLLVKAALTGFNLLVKQVGAKQMSEEYIDNLLNSYMVPANAKMMLLFDSKNIVLNPEDIYTYRGIQEAEMEPLLNGLIYDLKITDKTPRIIEPKSEKKKLSNQIVAVYFEKVKSKLQEFDCISLVVFLMKMHEDCVRARKLRPVHIPAKIACFSNYPTEVEKLQKEDQKLVNSALGIRCLIEFIAAQPSFGKKLPNLDDFDYMMACMNQLINWGMISDEIDLDISDPILEILPSERIGFEKEDILTPFAKARSESTVFDYQNSYEKRLKTPEAKEEKSLDEVRQEQEENNREINEAFTEEFRISLTKLVELKSSLIEVAVNSEKSIIEMEETKLKEELLAIPNNVLTSDEIAKGIDFLTLTKRNDIEIAPAGFDKTDVYPWKYNRALSLLRRPLVKIEKADGKSYYYYGYRHVSSTIDNLNSLIYKGRLKAKNGGLLNKFLAKINKEKGAEFRKEVFDWLISQNSKLIVIPYEVTIKPNGHLVADKDYGDIDILVIDETEKIFYPIECKNTVGARVAHEMKTEMDKYLGRNGEEGMVQKHVARDIWLKANLSKLKMFITNAETYTVKSLVLTSEELPILYLAKEKLSLPMLSFDKLSIKGIGILQDL